MKPIETTEMTVLVTGHPRVTKVFLRVPMSLAELAEVTSGTVLSVLVTGREVRVREE